MVKIDISIEGENLADIISELLTIGIASVKHNRKEIRELMRVLADEAVDVLMERKILEKGAKLYKEINSEINYRYKQS